MTGPLRMRDPGSGASAAARVLLAAAEPPSALPSATRERVRRALARRGSGSEGSAVCRSHALGFTLALATGCAFMLFSQSRRQQPERVSVAASATAVEAPPPRVTTELAPVSRAASDRTGEGPTAVVVAEPAPEAATPAGSVRVAVAETGRRASHRAPGRAPRPPGSAERSRKRIEAVVEEVLSPDAQLLDRARREVERAPLVALGLIEGYRRRHPESALPAPAALVEVDALRRLGRFEDAVARARALVDRKGDYADEMANRFAMLDL